MKMPKELFWRLRAGLSYRLARQLMGWPWLVRQPRAWRWMEGQFSRMANLGEPGAQSFYGHLLLFRGQGLAAQNEGLRLLRLAADSGDAKAAYQVGVQLLKDSLQSPAKPQEAATYWQQAAEAGHPLAAHKLAALYRQGAAGLPANEPLAKVYEEKARQLGF